MSAAEQSVLPTSVLAPKTMTVRRAAILFFAPLASVVPRRGHCRVEVCAGVSGRLLLPFATGYASSAAKDARAVLFWQFLALYMALLRPYSAGAPSVGVR